MRRLTMEELFHIGPPGLEEIGDETMNRRLDEIERRELERMVGESQDITHGK